MSKKLALDHITMGVCYHPQYWDKVLWKEDLERMKAYGIEVIRIAEYAWCVFESTEGVFTYDFFDEFMDLTVKEGMKVVFCIPSAMPPAWMSRKYPEILKVDMDEDPATHGVKRHCNLNSDKYRYFVSRITGQLVSHYAKYDNIIMWQLENGSDCAWEGKYVESDHKAFRKYLQKRYKNIDAYNKEILAVFSPYKDWEEVDLCGDILFTGCENPHLALLKKRFISDSVISFFKLQADVIRKYSNAFITTNDVCECVDHHRLVNEVLDFISFDSYPNSYRNQSAVLNRENGLKDRNDLKPGQMRLWTFQSIAHGADYVGLFCFRTATFGNKMYQQGILDHCNRPNRKTRELQQINQDIKKIQSLCGTEYVAEVAIIRDYGNIWDALIDKRHDLVDKISQNSWFSALQKKHIPFDYIDLKDDTKARDLFRYKLLIYPHPSILNERRADILERYIKHGGTVIFGGRTGYKKENGSCYMMPVPCYATKLVGANVEEYGFLNSDDEDPVIHMGTMTVSAPCFADVLQITDGKEIGVFGTNYYAGKSAVSMKQTGKGKAYYFGAAFAEDTAEYFLELEKIVPPMELGSVLELPESVELAIRGEYVILLNYSPEPVSFKCRTAFKDLISGKKFQRSISMEGYGVVVLERVTLKLISI